MGFGYGEGRLYFFGHQPRGMCFMSLLLPPLPVPNFVVLWSIDWHFFIVGQDRSWGPVRRHRARSVCWSCIGDFGHEREGRQWEVLQYPYQRNGREARPGQICWPRAGVVIMGFDGLLGSAIGKLRAWDVVTQEQCSIDCTILRFS